MDQLNLNLVCTCICSYLWIVPYELFDKLFVHLILSFTQVKLCVFLLLFKNHYLELMYCLMPPAHFLFVMTIHKTCANQHSTGYQLSACIKEKSRMCWQRINTLILVNRPRSNFCIVVFSRCQSVRPAQLWVWSCVKISWKECLEMRHCNFTKISPNFSGWKGWKAIKKMRQLPFPISNGTILGQGISISWPWKLKCSSRWTQF